jgi:tRNA threonylcarbamoyladenosine biosynthesis protein TsaE
LTVEEAPKTYQTTSTEVTQALGEALGRVLTGGMTIGLVGPLGAGKTHLVKGIAAGNGTADPRQITSPTFTLVHEYPGRLRLYHVDAYRLRGSSELIALGFDELVAPDSAVVVEWADRVRSAMPADTLWVEITPIGETSRHLAFHPGGPVAQQCLEAFRAAFQSVEKV